MATGQFGPGAPGSKRRRRLRWGILATLVVFVSVWVFRIPFFADFAGLGFHPPEEETESAPLPELVTDLAGPAPSVEVEKNESPHLRLAHQPAQERAPSEDEADGMLAFPSLFSLFGSDDEGSPMDPSSPRAQLEARERHLPDRVDASNPPHFTKVLAAPQLWPKAPDPFERPPIRVDPRRVKE